MVEITKLLSELGEYLKSHYTGKEQLEFRQFIVRKNFVPCGGSETSIKRLMQEFDTFEALAIPVKKHDAKPRVKLSINNAENLDKLLNAKRKTFSDKLFGMINAKELSEVQVYTKANLDRRLFSKMRRKDYTPSKNTVLALIIGMKLNMADAKELLTYAGYAFKPSSAVDMIVSFFVEQGEYDIFVLNEVLDGYGLELLGNAIK